MFVGLFGEVTNESFVRSVSVVAGVSFSPSVVHVIQVCVNWDCNLKENFVGWFQC